MSVGIGVPKEDWLRQGFEAYVDDKLGVLTRLEGVVPHRFLMNQPYNAHEILPEGVERVAGWPVLLVRLKELARARDAVIA
jgi:hypothetical protein